ncbi:hypothetical protein [Pedobacter sp. Hv1]|uniref:hypothetical protein n=1 Tax=Pedobacter sp. Hv1 TaxID=1740090 RepID=UPI00128F7E96|nr:hypothetical protein [Pedobacter sp. Hv1]
MKTFKKNKLNISILKFALVAILTMGLFSSASAAEGCGFYGNPTDDGYTYYIKIGTYNGKPQFRFTSDWQGETFANPTYCLTVTGAEGSCYVRYNNDPSYPYQAGRTIEYTNKPCNLPLDNYSWLMVVLVGGVAARSLVRKNNKKDAKDSSLHLD